MELSKKQKIYSQFLAPFLKSTSNYKQFEKMTTFICYLFLKLQTPKDLVRPISKKPHYRKPVDSHYIKDFYNLAESASQDIYQIRSVK